MNEAANPERVIDNKPLGAKDIAVVVRENGELDLVCTGVPNGRVMDVAALPEAAHMLIAFTLMRLASDQALMAKELPATSDALSEILANQNQAANQ